MKTIADPAQLGKTKKESLIELWENTLNGIDELLAQKDAIKAEFEARLLKAKLESDEENGWGVTRFPKVYTNKVTLEIAKKYGATENKEVVNSTILTKLVKSGEKIEGAEIRYEVRIAKLKEQGGDE